MKVREAVDPGVVEVVSHSFESVLMTAVVADEVEEEVETEHPFEATIAMTEEMRKAGTATFVMETMNLLWVVDVGEEQH